MRQSIFRWTLAALLGAAVFACHGLARAQFQGREMPPTEADRIPEALEQLVQAIDEQSLANPPERDFKVEKGSAQETKLFRADPKLLENKFSASVVLLVTTNESKALRAPNNLAISEFHAFHGLPKGMERIVDGRSGNFFFTGIEVYSGHNKSAVKSLIASDAIPTLSGYFKLLSELCPREQLPPQAAIDFLTSTDCDRDVKWQLGTGGDANQRRYWHIIVYAPSEESAEQRARAIVQLFDNGLCRPLQRDCLAAAKKFLEAAQKGYEEVARQSETIRAKEETLAKPSEITPDILSQLKAQKVMLAIDSAGLDARIKACNAMLKEGPAAPPSTRESINDMKVRAEVELIGSKEKLDRINGFIAEGNNRDKLREEIDRLRGTRQELQRQIDRTHERGAEGYARLVSLYAPLEIEDNQITISPIEWTN